YHLDQRRRGLLVLQSQEGQHDVQRGAHVAVADAVPTQRAPPAPQRTVVSAELSARQLAGLSLLGHRARSLTMEARRRAPDAFSYMRKLLAAHKGKRDHRACA